MLKPTLPPHPPHHHLEVTEMRPCVSTPFRFLTLADQTVELDLAVPNFSAPSPPKATPTSPRLYPTTPHWHRCPFRGKPPGKPGPPIFPPKQPKRTPTGLAFWLFCSSGPKVALVGSASSALWLRLDQALPTLRIVGRKAPFVHNGSPLRTKTSTRLGCFLLPCQK